MSDRVSKMAPESSATSPATPPSSAPPSNSRSSASTPPIVTDEITTKIADMAVVSNPKELEKSSGQELRREGVESGSMLIKDLSELIMTKLETDKRNPYLEKMVLLETTAPLDTPIVLEPIPAGLSWKFMSNPKPGAPRYWAKLKSSGGISESSGTDQRKKNLEILKQELRTLLSSMENQSEYTLLCEARFGKVDWRADSRRDLCIKDVLSLRNREFYVRTTTKTEGMIQCLRSITNKDKPSDCSPRNSVVLTVKDVEDGSRYKIAIDEIPRGTFIYDEEKAFDHYSKNLGRVTADFICIGRPYDVRISSTCKYQVSSSRPAEVMRDVEKIAESVQRADNGKLKMILKSGCVKVTFVRQMKRWNVTTKIDFYEVKETNTDAPNLEEDEMVELEHHENQEIEVKMVKPVTKDDQEIDEILKKVEELVHYAMDVVADKAEKYRDPDIPY